ncbi:protocadherin gamma-A11-like isoform X10 [Pristis pectinata]|uniref:protocadherin gamma-A11-like isoform X10 n=1 Tax=Pristis pectinata TaxID=685728 RepID=UPI00223CDDB5|nr:protocadherin gamma-A11-like isoform X10 [Pristis pectinata]
MRDNINWLVKYQLFCSLFSRWNLVYGQIRYSVPEELQVGAFVGNIAIDLGLDLKQLSARSLRVAPSPRKQYVDVNLENGILFVNEIIDREQLCGPSTECVLTFNVVLENPLSLHQVEVEILDVNDNAPSFPQNQIRLAISEIMAPGARFPLDAAHDPDIGTNSLQSYQLLPNEYFILDVQERDRIGKLPLLVLQRALDREMISIHELTLLAEDGGVPVRSGKVQVTITVKDANDNAPVFSQSVYKVNMLESSPIGTLIFTLNATDLDDGANGEITYALSSHNSAEVLELVGVNSRTGEIRLRGHLDFEKTKTFVINVQAVDNGDHAVPQQCDVLVDVIDVNDNAPDLSLTSLSNAVAENAPTGTIVALLSAEDKDSGQNGQVQCQIPNKLPFKLDSTVKNNWKLLIQDMLDRETTSRYDITVTCTDAGNPPLTSKKTIRMEVSDVNDNAPRFTHLVYTARVMENNVIGHSIFSLTAFDPDTGQNAQLKFTILNSSAAPYVSINSQTGVIFAQRSFDYEQLKNFQIQVRVQDSGDPPLTSNVTIDVVILDQNDNAPVIVHPLPEYGSTAMETISRFAEPGYLVVKVSATDADAGQNARLSYQIFQATHRDLFTISADTGEVWTIRAMESKDASKQRLVIVVKDKGTPSLSATVTIVLSVTGGETISSSTGLSEDRDFTPDLNLYLVIALGTTSIIFLVILIFLAIKVHKNRNGMGCQYSSLNVCCCYETRNSLNGIQKASRSLQIPPNYVEVFGGDPLSQSFRYESCSTLQSVKRDFTSPQTCGPSVAISYAQKKPIGKENEGMLNSDIYNCNTNTEVKQPNTDWRLSQTHRAELNSSQYLEEEGVQREIQCEVQREVQRDVQREVPRDVQCDVPRNVQRDLQRDVHCDVQHVAENDPGGPRKPMCARPPAIPAGRDGWTLPRTAPRMQLQMTLGTHVPGTLRSQYLFPREPCTPGARISNSNVEFSAFPIGSLHCPWAANQTRDHRGLTHPGSRRPELDTEACGEIPCSPSSLRLSTQRLHSRDHHHALRQVNN